jgi:hypothetical protein
MRIVLYFKTPDVVDNAIESNGLTENAKNIAKMCQKFVKYGEYLTVEISDETGEIVAKVLERG